MAEGTGGYLWLALGDGLYRFDGYRYEHIMDGPVRVPKYLAMEGHRLWMREMQRLAAFDGTRFGAVSVVPSVSSLASDRQQLLVNTGNVWMRWTPSGPEEIADSNVGNLTFDGDGTAWGVFEDDVVALARNGRRFERRWAGLGKGFLAALMSSSGRLWLTNPTTAVAFRDGKPDVDAPRVEWLRGQAESIAVMGRNGRVWIRGQEIVSDPPGIRFRYQLPQEKGVVGTVEESAHGDLWIHRPATNLLARMIPDLRWTVYREDEFGEVGPTQTMRDAAGRLWAATGSGVYLYENGWKAKGDPTVYYIDVLDLPDGRLLAASRWNGLWILSADGKPLEQIRQPALPSGRNVTRDFRRLYRDRNGRIWVGNRHVFLEAVPEGNSFRLEVRNLPTQIAYVSPIDLIEDKKGRLWVGHTEGLAHLNAMGDWEALPTDRPVTEVRTLSVDATGNTFWVGYRKNGFFSRIDIRNGTGIVTQFAASAGYGPRETRFLRVDSRGWVWRGTDDGVWVSDGVHTEPEDWLHLQSKNGLSDGGANPNGFREEPDGSVWICTTKGMVHMHPDASWFAAPEKEKPLLTRVEIDSTILVHGLETPPAEVPEGTQRVLVPVGSLAASPCREYPFRYRILPRDSDWRVVEKESILWESPVNGEHTLEIVFAGTGPATPRQWTFRVGPKPPPYLSYAGGASVALVVAGFLFRRTHVMELLRYRFAKGLHALRHRSQESIASQPDLVGRRIGGRYLVKRIASTGGTSTLYEAVDEEEGGRVAIKVLEGRAAEAKWTRRAFTTEAALLRSVSHPGVVPLLESWIDEEGRLILLMPYLSGTNLRKKIGCDAAEGVRLLEQLGDALDAIHARGIVHRDVKPDNVLVTEGGRVVLIDFGAAGMAGQREGMVVTEGISGTPAYMGPERLGGYFSGATDAYSLGVLSMELLTGKRPEDWPDGIGQIQERFGERAAALFVEILSEVPENRPTELGEWARRLRDALPTPR